MQRHQNQQHQSLLLRPFALVCYAVIAHGSVSGQVFAQTAQCIDIDGDGWGWDGSRSCLVDTRAQVQSSTCVDSDGDGYGWDGSRTCLVNAATTNNNTATSDSPASSEGACVDSDGDGWGWNGQRSCDATSSVQVPAPAPQQPSTQPRPINANNGSSYNASSDLIALHFDHAPDLDDGHAAVAAFMVTQRLNLNVQVVAGTYGEYSKDRYVRQSEALMSSVWGNRWLNAHSQRTFAVQSAVEKWTGVIANGGRVWVAEGGPSDFTAAVLRAIKRDYPQYDTRRRVVVVQHSDWNEDHALRSDLEYVRANTRYEKIDDGNDPNRTADLRFESHKNGSFVARARTSEFAGAWETAFRYLSPSEKLDFSDTVELLHILGIGTDKVSDINEFGDNFF